VEFAVTSEEEFPRTKVQNIFSVQMKRGEKQEPIVSAPAREVG